MAWEEVACAETPPQCSAGGPSMWDDSRTWDPRVLLTIFGCLYVRVCVYVRACVHVCVLHMYVRARIGWVPRVQHALLPAGMCLGLEGAGGAGFGKPFQRRNGKGSPPPFARTPALTAAESC